MIRSFAFNTDEYRDTVLDGYGNLRLYSSHYTAVVTGGGGGGGAK